MQWDCREKQNIIHPHGTNKTAALFLKEYRLVTVHTRVNSFSESNFRMNHSNHQSNDQPELALMEFLDTAAGAVKQLVTCCWHGAQQDVE
jgi:hypothetical protein